MSQQEILTKLSQAVIDGEPEEAAELAQQALDEGLDPLLCINEGLTPGMNRVGELFESGEYYLPDLIIGTDVMRAWGDRWYFSFAPEGGTVTVVPHDDSSAPDAPAAFRRR